MSGHSKWSTIKHQKATTDKKRGQIFSKLSRAISLAAKQGGDPAMNSSLRLAIDAARKFNVPKDNIERAVKRGTGEEKGAELEELLFEAYGPQGTALLIEAITDNSNRSTSEVRHALSERGGKLAESGAVRWMFSQKAVVRIDRSENAGLSEDELTMALITAGADDIKEEGEGMLAVVAEKERLAQLKKAVEDAGISVSEHGLEWIPQQGVSLKDQAASKQFEDLVAALDEREDVQNIYSNLAGS